MFPAPGHVFGCTEGVGSRFHIFLFRTRFRQYRGPRVPFSFLVRPDSFSAVPTTSNSIVNFSSPGHVFDGTEGVGSRFHVLRARTHFGGTRCVGCSFLVLCAQTRFRRYRGRRASFSCLALPESFSCFGHRVPFLCFPRPDSFWRYRVRRVPFSCFVRPDSFSAVKRVSGPVFMFCAPGIVFGGTEGVGSRFFVFRSRTRFRRYRGCRV
jgi:hypothetical protein